MIARTLYFGNPAYLSTANEQLVVEFTAPKGTDEITRPKPHTAPIEDIGVLILDHQQITISQALIAKLLANNVALITCDNTHHPTGLMLNLDGHTLQSQRFKDQLEASEPLKKQLWQQTIIAKIQNQAAVLGMYCHGDSDRYRNEPQLFPAPDKLLVNLSKEVKSGDSDNSEAVAAGYYWKNLFPPSLGFTRDRFGLPPNNLLNYGYAILRAIVARSLTGSGLLPTLGIHHRNQYNAYCLADDIMEPYRPYVDKLVCDIVNNPKNVMAARPGFSESPAGPPNSQSPVPNPYDLTPEIKKQLLAFPAMDVIIDEKSSPLMNAVQRTTASLAKCYEGKLRKLLYPALYTEK